MSHVATVPQSAALPYLVGGSGLQILLITSRGRGRWVLPKGNLAKGVSASRSAAREADEEAGIAGTIAETAIGTYTYRKSDDASRRLYAVDVFPMRVENVASDWLEAHQRRREWFPCDVAATLVEESALQTMIGRFGAVMGALSHTTIDQSVYLFQHQADRFARRRS